MKEKWDLNENKSEYICVYIFALFKNKDFIRRHFLF